MASVIDICNLGLVHIGARSQVVSIDPPDSSVEAGYCARFYPLARAELLESHSWSFALKRVALAEVDNASLTWSYAYVKPSDMIAAKRILQSRYLSTAGLAFPFGWDTGAADWRIVDDLFTERGSADFEIEGDVIYTNEPEAVIKYLADVTDTAKFSPLFTSALGMLLASYLAGSIIKGMDGARIGTAWRENAMKMAAKAAAADANKASERVNHVPEHMRARG